MTIGDVLAVVAGVAASGVTLWAALVTNTLLFPGRTQRASEILVTKPGRTIGFGLFLILTAGVIGFGLVVQPNGVLRLVGWAVSLALLFLASLGSAGLSLLLAERIQGRDEAHSPLMASMRAATLLVLACFVPLLGWFLLFPMSLAAGLGAGVHAVWEARPVRRGHRRAVTAPEAAHEDIAG